MIPDPGPVFSTTIIKKAEAYATIPKLCVHAVRRSAYGFLETEHLFAGLLADLLPLVLLISSDLT